MTLTSDRQPAIALVDDDFHSARLMTRMLAAHGGPHVERLSDPEAAAKSLIATAAVPSVNGQCMVVVDLKSSSNATRDFVQRLKNQAPAPSGGRHGAHPGSRDSELIARRRRRRGLRASRRAQRLSARGRKHCRVLGSKPATRRSWYLISPKDQVPRGGRARRRATVTAFPTSSPHLLPALSRRSAMPRHLPGAAGGQRRPPSLSAPRAQTNQSPLRLADQDLAPSDGREPPAAVVLSRVLSVVACCFRLRRPLIDPSIDGLEHQQHRNR